MTHALALDDFDDRVAPPLWRDAVVGASIAAMAAAAGLGMHYEAGAAPWLSMVMAGATALALWGAHRQFGRIGTLDRTPARAKRARTLKAKVSTSGESKAAQTADAAKVELPELSSFTPRPTHPVELAAGASAGVVLSTPSTKQPREAAPHAMDAERSVPPAIPSIDPEAQFLRLQGLVRQLATDVSGPRAETVDPDFAITRPTRQPNEIPALTVGFSVGAAHDASHAPATEASSSPFALRLAEAVAAERVDVLLEPIQLLAESRARHFEISVRFRSADGDVLPSDDVARVARTTGLAPSIDALKLPRIAKVVQRVLARGGSPSDVLAALAGASLADHAFMEAFAKSFSEGAPASMVLSFPQADVRAFARVHWSALNALGDMGLRFALNDVTDLDMDFELLRARSFVFAKLDAEVFLNGLPCGGTVVPASDICKHIADAGFSLIVAHLDSEEQLARVAAFAVPFGQGRLFGGARPVKSDILR